MCKECHFEKKIGAKIPCHFLKSDTHNSINDQKKFIHMMIPKFFLSKKFHTHNCALIKSYIHSSVFSMKRYPNKWHVPATIF